MTDYVELVGRIDRTTGPGFIREPAANGGMSDGTRPARRTILRTLGLLGTGTVAAATASASTGDARRGRADGATRYIGVVDRIVDGEHVVILLEDCDSIVDQLVVSADRYDDLSERDILLTVVEDDDLLSYCHLSEKPSDCRGIGDSRSSSGD
ncbi:hypothetical protein SAMN05216285_3228 [Natrinema salifodinae]|uniref:Uncharacterized protein n=2 Tax=Natrinema salifodinae TaxID=1202768 RepID=A0A1I0Q8P8_9EURY|nr:hypothetical protein SAMN05216285_3228 [Natrinema salifodinae]